MSKKVSGTISIATFVLTFILMLEYRFFYIIKFPDFFQKIFTYQNKTLLCLISILLFIIWGRVKGKLELSRYVWSLFLWACISFVYCVFTYKPQMNEVLVPLAAYTVMLLYYPLVNMLKRDLSKIISLLTWLNVIACIILLMQFIVYRQTGKIFLSVYEFYKTGFIPIRDGNIRIIYSSTIVSLSALISMGKVFDSYQKDKWLHSANFLLSLLYFYFVSQTRMYVISLLIVFVLLFIKANSKWKLSKIISFLIGIIFIFLVFFFFGFFDYVIDLVTPLLYGTYQNDGSYYARLDAIEFYLSVIKEKPVLGLGIFDPERTSYFYNLVHGSSGKLFYTDIGILGSMAKLGIPIGIWYILLLRKMGAIVLKVKENVLFSIYCFIVLSTLTLVAIDPQRLFFLMFSLALFEVYAGEKNSGELNEIY